MELQSTNIVKTAKSSTLIIILIAVVVAAVIMAGLVTLLVVRKRKANRSSITVAKPVMETAPKSASISKTSVVETSNPVARLKQLKGMLDAGLITQQDYDEEKRKILEPHTK